MPYQQPDGRWRAVKKINGQRKQKIFRTKAEAKKWEVEQNFDDWQVEKIHMACLFDVADAYLTYSKARHHPTTYKDKRFAIKLMLSYIKADRGPEQVTPRVALQIIMDKAKQSHAAANKLRKHLSAFWEYCSHYYGYPKENPFRGVEKLPENSEPHYVPPAEDFWKVFAEADDSDRVLLLALLYTAGRRSEPFRWTWENDIDLVSHRIRLSTCKTKDGSRKYEWMHMPDRLHSAFVVHRSKCTGQGHVFRSRNTGEAYVDRKHFVTNLCKRAGVRPFNFHGIRGLCATLLAQNNVPMKQIQGVLMHANMTTTDRYVRRIGGVSDDLGRAFEKFDKCEVACKVISFEAAS